MRDALTTARNEIGFRTRVLRENLGSPVVQFALAGFAAVVLVGLVSAFFLERAGTEQAIRNAKRISSLAGEGIVEPVVGQKLLAGSPAALAEIDEVVEHRILGYDGVVRVKIWNADSRIVYSDEPRLIGETFDLDEEELGILWNGGTEAETTDLSSPENQFESSDAELVEVYLPIHTRSGEPLLFETYIESSFISTRGQQIWSTLAPVMIGALIVLALLQLPLATSLARRLRRGQEEREALLTRAIDASEMERRRIAQDLHDGVVQDLAGVSYSVEAAAGRAQSGEVADPGALRQAASRLRQSLRDLRGLLVEIYPPDLHRSGLGPALSDAIGRLGARGLSAELAVPEDLILDQRTETLLFRIAQEAIRNVVAHADAENIRIGVTSEGGSVALEVSDDGAGFAPAARDAHGHFGLRMLEDLAREEGGTLTVDSEPGCGTRIRVEVPVA